MTNNKAREVNNPIIKQLIDETSPEELAKIDTEMINNKQQTAVEWFANQLHRVVSNTTDALTHNHKELLEQAKEMEVMGREMSYSDGYADGYKRALELVEWYIKNHISGMVQDHIVDTNKMVGGGEG